MIKLKESQETKKSDIDAVVASLNTIHAKTPALVEQGMKMIHAAIVKKP